MTHPGQPRSDPDPFVLDLLMSLATTAVSGVLVKVGKASVTRLRDRSSHEVPAGLLAELAQLIDELSLLVRSGVDLFQEGTKNELGGVLLLPPDKIARYHEIREQLFEKIREADRLAEEHLDQYVELLGSLENRDLPVDFRVQLSFVEKRLKEARTAALAEESLLATEAAILGLRRMLRRIAQDAGGADAPG